MKRFHRRCRRLCILAALLVLLVLFLRQNVLLDTASRHAILLDAQSGQVLAQKRALDKQVTLPEGIFPALQIEKASMAGFAPGETVTVRDLLYGAMLPSGAECCEALARLVSGSEDNFAALMNQKATELGMKNTHFTNPTGLTDTEHYSSAADMAKLLQAALHNATFRTIFTAEHYTTTATAQHPEGVSLTSTLLGKLDGTELPEGAQIEGGKTGYTAAAGLCLASLATVNGKEYILVTLAAPGDHGTEQYNIRDAVHVYRKLADKK